jgi:hypothetical protein
MADAADDPEAAVIDCGLAMDIPAVGSALDVGQIYLAVLFLEASPFVCAAEAEDPVEAFVAVEELDETEDSDDDEFDRVTVFLVEGMSILDTSSAPMECRPLGESLEDPHDLGMF